MKKFLLSFALIFLLTFGIVCTVSAASGKCGDNVSWSLGKDGILFITGSGDMEDYKSYEDVPWSKYSENGDIKKVLINGEITHIGSYSLAYLDSDIDLYIKNIGDEYSYATNNSWFITADRIYVDTYGDCSGTDSSVKYILDKNGNITICGNGSMKFYEELEEIPWYSKRKNICEVVIDDGITSVSDNAFYECTNLVSVKLSNDLGYIGWGAFSSCRLLQNVTLPESLVYIEDFAFCGCESLKGIILPSKLTYLGTGAFADCESITDIQVRGGVFTELSKDMRRSQLAFSGCNSLTNVSIPNGFNALGMGFMARCDNLESVYIPSSVSNIYGGAFNACPKLNNITVSSNNPYFSTYNGILFDKSKTKIIKYPDAKTESRYTIPNTVKTIGELAFALNDNITEITIPDYVTTIEERAFMCCKNLKSIIIPKSVTSIAAGAFDSCENLKEVYYYGNVDDWNKISIGEYNDCLNKATRYYQITTEYRSDLIENASLEFEYSDKYFTENDGYTYNHDLAKATLALELSSWTAIGADDKFANDRMSNISSLYDQLDFENVVPYNYDDPLSDNSDKVAYSFAAKELYDGSTLVAVVVRGGGYGAEWRSNFNVGTSSEHAGFKAAAEEVYSNLVLYMSDRKLINQSNKIWITGYSRGGAVANIVAARINCDALVNPRNLYAYTFATPNNVKIKETNADHSTHDNIYNIVLPYDLVPKVALEDWGFGKYGKTLMVKKQNPSSKLNDGHEIEFSKMTGLDYDLKRKHANASDNLVDMIDSFSATSTHYSNEYQNFVMDFVEWWFYRKDTYEESLLEFIENRYRYDIRFPVAYEKFVKNNDASFLGEMKFLAYIHGINQNHFVFDLYLLLVDGIGFSDLNMGVVTISSVYMTAHNPEYYIAWLYAYNNPKDIYERSTYKKLTIACPVNLNVYDSTDTIVASVVNNEVVVDILPVEVIGESAEIYFYDGEDIEDYTIEIEAYDEGNVNYSVTEYENNGVETRKINYANISVSTGTKLSGNVPIGQKLEAELYNLTSVTDGEETTVAFTDDLTGEDLQNLTVDVTVEGDGSANDIYFATKGELVTLEANPYHDASFVGWYNEKDELISENEEYSFILSESINVTAKFTRCTAVMVTGIPEITNNLLNVDGIISSAKNINGRCIIAVYSEDDNLLDVKITNAELGENTEKEVKENINTSLYDKEAAYIKLFLWDSLENLNPLCINTTANIQ